MKMCPWGQKACKKQYEKENGIDVNGFLTNDVIVLRTKDDHFNVHFNANGYDNLYNNINNSINTVKNTCLEANNIIKDKDTSEKTIKISTQEKKSTGMGGR